MKGQISTELLLILGVIILLFSTLFSVIYFKLLTSQNELDILRATLSLNSIISSANTVAKSDLIILDLSFPKDSSLEVVENGYALKVSIAGKDIVRYSSVKLVNKLPSNIIPSRIMLKRGFEDGEVVVYLMLPE